LSKSLVSMVSTKVVNTLAMAWASPGEMTPPASAAVTAPIASAISAALLIGGSANSTARSRGKIRSRHSRIANGSPARAASTALRVSVSASLASSFWAAIVALLREPNRRPAGFPDCPLGNGRPRTRSDGFSATLSTIRTSLHWRQPRRHRDRLKCAMLIGQFYGRSFSKQRDDINPWRETGDQARLTYPTAFERPSWRSDSTMEEDRARHCKGGNHYDWICNAGQGKVG
jgi:hypothetical protein